jgi:D-3-phosphoglycerate dehydrogenase
VDNIDLDAARGHGVVVVNAPLAVTAAVAEHALALMLALAREIPRADASVKQGQWAKKELFGIELAGKTLGVIGVGRIGAALTARAKALGMRILGHDPLIPEDAIRQAGAEPVPLEALLAESDFISLHVPLTETTRGMMRADMLARCKPGARLISTARGGVIDEQALLASLDQGHIAGAALDVFTTEPPGRSPLVLHPRVICTPHIAAQTREAQVRAARDIAEEVLAALEGRSLRWRVV